MSKRPARKGAKKTASRSRKQSPGPALDPETVLSAYVAAFRSPDGEIVLDDLRQSFVNLDNPGIVDELKEYPHPYRAYIEKGMRIVIEKIDAGIALGEALKGIIDDDEQPDTGF